VQLSSLLTHGDKRQTKSNFFWRLLCSKDRDDASATGLPHHDRRIGFTQKTATVNVWQFRSVLILRRPGLNDA
jgi:hypothetical protein